MCGIICEISKTSTFKVKGDILLLQRIKNRGPDCLHSQEINLSNGLFGFFYGAVLWMQGDFMTPQPIEECNGVFLFNGDILDDDLEIPYSDTVYIFDKINKMNSEYEIIKELKKIKGPFSLIYCNKATQELYFTRDRLGRNSLLFHENTESFMIGSVLGRNYDCIEIPATHIYKIDLSTNKIKGYPWQFGIEIEETLGDWWKSCRKLQDLPDDQFRFKNHITQCPNEENFAYIDLVKNIISEKNDKVAILKKLLNHEPLREIVEKVTELLEKSVKLRVGRQPNKCRECLHGTLCLHSSVGVLFSGGLDCTTLAVLADKFIPQEQCIDLINIAFSRNYNESYDVPDRLTGKQSLEELQRLCPNRYWVFREINVTARELEKYQKSHIADLVYPRQTILDESLGSAFWFAARAREGEEKCPCRLLLLGSGADELFGGYSRHRKAFRENGWSELSKELNFDWKRISYRNLARDNRVICDHGRHPRMPYLDEDFTDYVLSLPPWVRCFPCDSVAEGLGDKLLLRLVAFNLGLEKAAVLPKRAVQFGSRIANKKDKGSDISKSFQLNEK